MRSYENRNRVNFTHAATPSCGEDAVAANMKEYHECGNKIRRSLISDLDDVTRGLAGGPAELDAAGRKVARKKVVCGKLEELLGKCFGM